jgi:hypothetical protein
MEIKNSDSTLMAVGVRTVQVHCEIRAVGGVPIGELKIEFQWDVNRVSQDVELAIRVEEEFLRALGSARARLPTSTHFGTHVGSKV